jgi:hypothetical protein
MTSDARNRPGTYTRPADEAPSRANGWHGDLASVRVAASELRMPGRGYHAWLEHFHAALKPATYLEIGVATGQALALARPPTRVIGVDPVPTINYEFKTETYLFTEMSDEFFARGRLAFLLDGHPLALAFIDGAHLFEQVLGDFINIESHCGPWSVVLIHDTVPLDEASQERVQRTAFYTGDIWKTVLCLKHYRPDLDIFTIATPWTGLTVVTGLNPASRVLENCYEEAKQRFTDMPFSDFEPRLRDALNLVPNDWEDVQRRLEIRGILQPAKF